MALSMKDFQDRAIPPGSSSFDILFLVARVARKKLKEELKEKERNIKTQMAERSSEIRLKIKGPNPMAEAYAINESVRNNGGLKQKRLDDEDDCRLKKNVRSMVLYKEMASPSKELEVKPLYSLSTMKTERPSPIANYVMSSVVKFPTKKRKSIDDGRDKDWGSEPKKPKSTKSKHLRKLDIRIPSSTNPNDLPEELKRRIESLEGIESFEKANLNLVIEKKLYQTDLAASACRISMPLKQIKPQSFLDDKEIAWLAKYAHDPDQNMHVWVIDPRLKEWELKLKQWDMPKPNGTKSSSYVLKGGWNELVKNNRLKESDVVQIWSFRDVDRNLRFAIVLVDQKAAKKGSAGSLDSNGSGGSIQVSPSTTLRLCSKRDVVDGESNDQALPSTTNVDGVSSGQVSPSTSATNSKSDVDGENGDHASLSTAVPSNNSDLVDGVSSGQASQSMTQSRSNST